MERLTIRGEDGKAYWVDARCAGGGYRMTNDTRDQARLDRCAAYEDTGLEPGEITVKPHPCVFYSNRRCTLDNDWCAEGPGCQKEMGRKEAAHLRELVQAEQDGRCVVLPDGMTVDALRAAYTHATELADEVLPSPSYTTGHLNGFWSGQAAALRMVLDGAEAAQKEVGEHDGA